MSKRHMIRWQLSLLLINLLTVAACASPASTLAPDAPRAAATAVAVSPIRRIAAALVDPFQLRSSAQVVLQVLHDASGAPLIEQRGLNARGAQLVVRTTATGVIRSISRDGVPLGTSSLSRAALLSTALRQLNALGIATPASAPAITDVGGRRIVLWERRVATALVPGDGLRMILAADGAFVGLAQPAPLPLAATPPANSRASAAQAMRAAARLAPADAILGDASLRWVAPGKSGGDEPLNEPLRLVWNIAGTLASGTPFALHLDVVSLQLLGWDWAA